jgi:outer membrane protein assembly factor BamB
MNTRFTVLATRLALAMAVWQCAVFAQWPSPRQNPRNTAFSGRSASLAMTPVRRWRYVPLQGSISSSYLAVGDLDGDGRPEIAAGSSPMGAGNENAGAVWVIDRLGQERWWAPLDGYVKWASPAIARLDADTLHDVVVGSSWWSSLFAFRGTDGDTLWTALEGLSQVGMNAGDLEGDSVIDVVVADYQSPRHVRSVNGSGQVEWTAATSGTTYNIPAIGTLGDNRGVAFTAHAPAWREQLYFLDPDGDEIWTYPAAPTAEQLQLTPPELGYLADYGYVSAVLDDFDCDGQNEVGFGTDLNYYVVEPRGGLRWRQPTGLAGNGFTALLDGVGDTLSCVDHHYQVMDAAVADLNGDGASDVVYGLMSDWWGNQVQGDPSSLDITAITYRNALVARSGVDGSLLWRFDARHPCIESRGIGRMGEPVACLVGDEVVVIAGSNDGYLYAVRGSDGQMLWELWGNWYLWQRGMALADLDGDGSDELLVVHQGGIEAWSSLAQPTLWATADASGVHLAWSGDPATQAWKVYRGSAAWFSIGETELLAQLPGAEMSLIDPAEGFLHNPAMNAYYRVVGMAGTAASVPSRASGEFDWALDDSRCVVHSPQPAGAHPRRVGAASRHD